MAKGAASENALGALHAKLAIIFTKVLETYEARLDMAQTAKTAEELSDEMVSALLDANLEPSPAMLSAISKFLKDNDIAFDSDEISKLSDTEERLKARRKRRGELVNLTDLRVVNE